ncbi:MAG: family 16 glycoside hydrolase [Oscillospiraceae bacterium]
MDGAFHEIPANIDGYVDEVGVIVCDKTHASLSFYLDDLYVDGSPEYRLDFSKIKDEAWNGIHREVSQFSRLKGLSYLDGKYLSLSCSDFGEMYTGHYNWENYAFTATLKPITGENHYVNFRVQGAIRSYAVGFSGKDTVTLQKNKNGYQILQRENFSWEYGKEYEISIMAENNRITVWVDGKELMHYQDENSPILSGAIGLSVRDGSHCLYRDFIVKG